MRLKFIDAHCHLTDIRLAPRLSEIIQISISKGVVHFIQGGIGPRDWENQKALKQKYPDKISLCFGLHPYWVSASTEADCLDAIKKLDPLLTEAVALGELGLDFREKIVGPSRAQQIAFFERQLEIWHQHNKVGVFHFVRCHDEAIRRLTKWGLPSAGGMVHSFNSNYVVASKYLDLGLKLSIGGPLLQPQNHTLKDVVKKIPLESLILESDSPDQAPPLPGLKYNEPWTLCEVAHAIAELRGIAIEKLSEAIQTNTQKLFHFTL